MNQKGFAHFAFLIFLPILLACLAVVGAAYLILNNDGETRHLCRESLLQSQKKVAQILRDLMALNPEAKALRLQREAAEKALALAATPADKAAALAALEIILMQQAALAAQQEALIWSGKQESILAPSRTQRSIEAALLRARRVQASETQRVALNFAAHAQRGAFDVIASPSGDLTPDYNPSAVFSERQIIRLEWSFSASALLPSWLHSLVKPSNVRARAICSATLEKKGTSWVPKLRMDKP